MSKLTQTPATQLPRQLSGAVFFAVGLMGFGITVLLMSVFYIHDLALLREIPDMIWQFICGVPSDNPTTFPLLISTGILTLMGGTVLLIVHQLHYRRRGM